MAQVGCPDRRIDRLCITCCSLPISGDHAPVETGAIRATSGRAGIIASLVPLAIIAPRRYSSGLSARRCGDFVVNVAPATLRPRYRYLVPWILADSELMASAPATNRLRR